MLASGKMVGFIPTKDYDKARAFYEGKLGFDYVSLDKFALVMSIGGALGGLAGICEVAAIQGRLQPGISAGYGLTGFLVAWLSGHNPFIAIVVSFLIGGLIAAGDSLQLYAKVPAASATILQGLLFATALAVGGLSQRWRTFRG